jgi:hypothetical protein
MKIARGFQTSLTRRGAQYMTSGPTISQGISIVGNDLGRRTSSYPFAVGAALI